MEDKKEAEASFPIPDLPGEGLPSLNVVEQKALIAAAQEEKFYSSNKLKTRFEGLDRGARFVMKPALFLFVLGLNLWWDRNVQKMVWESGRARSNFHLDNTVLIALLTTSIANFLALLIIVAKHLFPAINSSQNESSTRTG